VSDAERQELNRKLAEKMGWTCVESPLGNTAWKAPDGQYHFDPPDYTRDDNAMREVRAEILKRDKMIDFAIECESKLVMTGDAEGATYRDYFTLIDCPTEIQAKAAAEVL